MKKYLIKKVMEIDDIKCIEYFGINCTSCTETRHIKWFASFAGYESKESVENVIKCASKYISSKMLVEEVDT